MTKVSIVLLLLTCIGEVEGGCFRKKKEEVKKDAKKTGRARYGDSKTIKEVNDQWDDQFKNDAVQLGMTSEKLDKIKKQKREGSGTQP